MTFNWEAEINNLIPPNPATDFTDTVIKYDYFLGLIRDVPGAEALAAEMERVKAAACTDFHEMVSAIDNGAIAWQEGEEADLFAAMSFVTWYLHKSWKTLRDPLPIQYARVLGYVLLVGMQIGAYLHGQAEHPHPESRQARADDPDPGSEESGS